MRRRAWMDRCAALAALCGPLSTAGCSAFGGSNGNDIEVGMLVSLTGRFSTRGRNLQDAVRVAETQINQIGVLDGRHIQFKYIDDASKSEQALAGANSLL